MQVPSVFCETGVTVWAFGEGGWFFDCGSSMQDGKSCFVVRGPDRTPYYNWQSAYDAIYEAYEKAHKPKPVTAWDVAKGKHADISAEERPKYNTYLNAVSKDSMGTGDIKNFFALFRLAQAEADRINKENGIE